MRGRAYSLVENSRYTRINFCAPSLRCDTPVQVSNQEEGDILFEHTECHISEYVGHLLENAARSCGAKIIVDPVMRRQQVVVVIPVDRGEEARMNLSGMESGMATILVVLADICCYLIKHETSKRLS